MLELPVVDDLVAQLGGEVLGEPPAHLVPEGRLLGGIVEVHGRAPVVRVSKRPGYARPRKARALSARSRPRVAGPERERREGADGVARAHAKRVVAAEDDARVAEGLEDQPEGARGVGERVDVDPAHVLARRLRDRRAPFRRHVPPVVDAPEHEGKRPAAVREAPAQARPPLDDAPVDHAGHAERRLEGEAEGLHQVVLAEALAAEHGRRGVDEDGGVEGGGRLPDGVEALVVEVAPVDVAADLDAGEPERAHRPLELLHREVGRLQRQRGRADEAIGVPGRRRRRYCRSARGRTPPRPRRSTP